MAEKIRQACERQIRFAIVPEAEMAGILVIAGCKTACIDLSTFRHLPVFRVTREDDAGCICRTLGNHLLVDSPDPDNAQTIKELKP
jgi:hypothetical protein